MSRFTGSLGPSTLLSGGNALIRIHQDTPNIVQQRFPEKQLRFQFISETIGESMAPRYERMSVMGRSEDYISYAGNDNRMISLTLDYVASAEQEDSGSYDLPIRAVRFFQSLMMPTYADGGLMFPPPLCLLVLGKIVCARGLVTNAGITHATPFGGGSSTFEYPMKATIDLEFTCVNNRPLETSDYMPLPYLRDDPSMRSQLPFGSQVRQAFSQPAVRSVRALPGAR